MDMKKIITVLFLYSAMTTSSQNVEAKKYSITNPLFKNTLISLLNIQKELNKTQTVFDYDIHYISFEDNGDEGVSLTFERVKYDYISSELLDSKELGYFRLQGEDFMVNGYIPNLFKKGSKVKIIKLPPKDKEPKIQLFDGALGEWKFTLYKGNLLLEEGLLYRN